MDNFSSYSSSYYEGIGEGGAAPLWVIATVNVILCLVTVVGNFIVILAYARDDRIRQTVAYTIILNLSITDILVGILIFPLNTLWWINDKWAYGSIPCKLWLVLDYSLLSMSTFTIVYISLDRYWLLKKGFLYHRFQTMRKIVLVLSVAWVITILTYLFIAFFYPGLDPAAGEEFDSENCELEVVQSRWFNIFELVVQFAIPFSVLIFLNWNVYRNVSERSRGFVSIRYKTNNKSTVGANARDHRESCASQLSTIGIEETKPTSKPTEVEGHEEDVSSSSNQPSIILIENEDANGSTITTSGTEDIKTPIKPVSIYPITETEPSSQASESHSSVSTNCEAPIKKGPVEKKIRQSFFGRGTTESKSHRKAAITLGALVTVFCVCWLPYYICAIIGAFCEDCISYKVWEAVSYFQWCNSAINPFIYGITNVLFRRHFVKFFHLEACSKKAQTHSSSSSYVLRRREPESFS